MNDRSSETTARTYQDGLRDAADLLTVKRADMLLAAGEMTAQELRSVRAILEWRQRVIRSKADE